MNLSIDFLEYLKEISDGATEVCEATGFGEDLEQFHRDFCNYFGEDVNIGVIFAAAVHLAAMSGIELYTRVKTKSWQEPTMADLSSTVH